MEKKKLLLLMPLLALSLTSCNISGGIKGEVLRIYYTVNYNANPGTNLAEGKWRGVGLTPEVQAALDKTPLEYGITGDMITIDYSGEFNKDANAFEVGTIINQAIYDPAGFMEIKPNRLVKRDGNTIGYYFHRHIVNKEYIIINDKNEFMDIDDYTGPMYASFNLSNGKHTMGCSIANKEYFYGDLYAFNPRENNPDVPSESQD